MLDMRCHHHSRALWRKVLAVFYGKAMQFLLLFLPLLLHYGNNGSSCCCCCMGHEYNNLQKKGEETNASQPSLEMMQERPFFSSFSSSSSSQPPDARPPVEKRLYKSVAVEKVIADMKGKLRPPLDVLFSNCWPNTLDTTVVHVDVPTSGSEENNNNALHEDDDDAFVITGDIRAMWLRDSTNQVLPYAHLLQHDGALQDLFFGLLQQQARSILVDAYANAFNFNGSDTTTGSQDHQNDKRVPAMQPSIFEGKYELDSLAAFLRLSRAIYESGVAFRTERSWINAVKQVLDVIEEQQAGTMESFDSEQPPYRFERCEGDLANSGYGPPAFRNGLVKSAFRPSDDPTALPFHVPANAMVAVELQHLGSMLLQLQPLDDDKKQKQNRGQQRRQELIILSKRATRLSDEIHAALRAHAIVTVPNDKDCNNRNNDRRSATTQVFAYEADGFGNTLLMDDANTPSLLSLPLLGYDINGGKHYDDSHIQYNMTELYRATRSRILSHKNPYYFSSSGGHSSGSSPTRNSTSAAATSSYSNNGGGYRYIAGIGSPHTGPGRVWPMALITQALTSDSDEEITKCLDTLVETAAATGFMNESFSVTNASDFTRSWFAWANGLFGTLVLALAEQRPWLVMRRPQQQE